MDRKGVVELRERESKRHEVWVTGTNLKRYLHSSRSVLVLRENRKEETYSVKRGSRNLQTEGKWKV